MCDACVKRFYWCSSDSSCSQGGDDEDDRNCNICPEGVTCDESNTRIPTFEIQQGYYRFSRFDHHVYKCMYASMCLGVVDPESNYNVTCR